MILGFIAKSDKSPGDVSTPVSALRASLFNWAWRVLGTTTSVFIAILIHGCLKQAGHWPWVNHWDPRPSSSQDVGLVWKLQASNQTYLSGDQVTFWAIWRLSWNKRLFYLFCHWKILQNLGSLKWAHNSDQIFFYDTMSHQL